MNSETHFMITWSAAEQYGWQLSGFSSSFIITIGSKANVKEMSADATQCTAPHTSWVDSSVGKKIAENYTIESQKIYL